MTPKSPFEPCAPCEMKASCTRDSRCWRPRTVDYWRKQVQIATEALNVAAANLNESSKRWKEAMDQEMKT